MDNLLVVHSLLVKFLWQVWFEVAEIIIFFTFEKAEYKLFLRNSKKMANMWVSVSLKTPVC